MRFARCEVVGRNRLWSTLNKTHPEKERTRHFSIMWSTSFARGPPAVFPEYQYVPPWAASMQPFNMTTDPPRPPPLKGCTESGSRLTPEAEPAELVLVLATPRTVRATLSRPPDVCAHVPFNRAFGPRVWQGSSAFSSLLAESPDVLPLFEFFNREAPLAHLNVFSPKIKEETVQWLQQSYGGIPVDDMPGSMA